MTRAPLAFGLPAVEEYYPEPDSLDVSVGAVIAFEISIIEYT